MSEEEIIEILIQSINETQEDLGDTLVEITSETCPFDDLDNFDSLRALKIAMILEIKLSLATTIDEKVFIKENRNARTIKETAIELFHMQKEESA